MISSLVPVLASLLSVAFLGSWHCGAMCGPIAAALGRDRSLGLYHLGRLVSYTLVGALAGKIGETVANIVDVRLKVLGFFCLAGLLIYALIPHHFFKQLRSPCTKFSSNGKRRSYFVFGALSVFIPCGWLWSFVGAAAATGGIFAGALVLFCLWLSSLPALALATAYFRASLKNLPAPKRAWVNWLLAGASFYSLVALFFFRS